MIDNDVVRSLRKVIEELARRIRRLETLEYDISSSAPDGGHVIQDEGSDLPAEVRLNFIGAGVVATDNPITGATDVTIAGSASSGHDIQDDGVDLPAEDNLNFRNGLTAVDDAGNSATVVDVGEGPGIDIASDTVGIGADSIELIKSDGNPAEEYVADAGGFDAASAAAVPGDAIRLYAVTITSNHTLAAGVKYECHGTIFSGQLTLAADTELRGAKVTRTANDANALVGVVGPATGTAYLKECDISTVQSGAGNSYGVQGGAGDLILWDCDVDGQSVGGDGYGIDIAGGDVYILFGRISGSTDRLLSSGTDQSIVKSSSATAKALNLWNGAANDSPPASWETTGFDDSGWSAAVSAYRNASYARLPDCEVLWSQYQSTVLHEQSLVRQGFAVPAGVIISATLQADWDDILHGLYLNGTLIADSPDETFNIYGQPGAPFSYDVTSHVVAGATNVLAYHGQEENLETAYIMQFIVFKLTINYSGIVYTYAVEWGTVGTATGVPMWGDRSAWDVESFAPRHASDIDASQLLRHLPLPTRGTIPVGDANPYWDVLAPGDDGDILAMDGSDPAWKTAAELGLLNDTIAVALHDLSAGTIVYYNEDGTGTGVDTASAAAAAGDTIILPSKTIAGDHALTAGVRYVGVSRFGTILTGKITGADGATLENLTISRTANDANNLIGYESPMAGTTKLFHCHITVTQSGAGAAHAIHTSGGNVEVWDCYTNGQSVGGDGYGTYNAGGLVIIDGGARFGSTSPGADI